MKKKDFKLFGPLSRGELPNINENVEHEPHDKLDAKTLDISRIIHSIIEEFEAFDVYNQRMVSTEDDDLREILKHNRDEEIDHAMMLLEKMRELEPAFDERMKKYLLKEVKVKD